jgi:hypothetical protein
MMFRAPTVKKASTGEHPHRSDGKSSVEFHIDADSPTIQLKEKADGWELAEVDPSEKHGLGDTAPYGVDAR